MSFALQQAVRTLKAGNLLAYPTEAVFGLGCDINNARALKNLRRIKGRSPHKGFIILCASLTQLRQTFPYLNLSNEQLELIEQPQVHPTTWLLPFRHANKPKVAKLLVGMNHSIAVRIPQHPMAMALCQQVGPIVSSSANMPRGIPAKKIIIVQKNFRAKINYYLPGEMGLAKSPSQIIDIQTGRVIRAAKK